MGDEVGEDGPGMRREGGILLGFWGGNLFFEVVNGILGGRRLERSRGFKCPRCVRRAPILSQYDPVVTKIATALSTGPEFSGLQAGVGATAI